MPTPLPTISRLPGLERMVQVTLADGQGCVLDEGLRSIPPGLAGDEVLGEALRGVFALGALANRTLGQLADEPQLVAQMATLQVQSAMVTDDAGEPIDAGDLAVEPLP